MISAMVDGAKIHITRNAGWFAGDNMTGGELISKEEDLVMVQDKRNL